MRQAGLPTLAIGHRINPYEYRCHRSMLETLLKRGGRGEKNRTAVGFGVLGGRLRAKERMRRRPQWRATAQQHQQHHRGPNGGTGRQTTREPSSEPQAVRIGLLGGFRVSIGPVVIGEEEWRLRKARSLIKLLALSPGHR
jgi:hypothetical protein